VTGRFEHITENKNRERRRLAALPFAEKLRLLEKMRDRAAAIIASRGSAPDMVISDRALLVREHSAAYGTTPEKEDRDAE
jgi:hypothetical protein